MRIVRGHSSLTRVTVGLALLGFGVVLSQGCTLTVDVDSLQAQEEGLKCNNNQNVCPDKDHPGRSICVGLDNPAYGCGDQSCSACPEGNASIRCNRITNSCEWVTCDTGFADCDGEGAGEPRDGDCETRLSNSFNHCGSCGNSCERPNAIMNCVNGGCVFNGCFGTHLDCNGDVLAPEEESDGCETLKSDGCPSE